MNLLPITLKEFNEIIDKSEEDFTNGREPKPEISLIRLNHRSKYFVV